jgi:hypothetical protein
VSTPAFGLAHVRVRSFRSARDVTFAPGALCALVGEANAGKSNLLAAIRALLDPGAPPLVPSDVAAGDGPIEIEATLRDGHRLTLADRSGAPPVICFPAALRSSTLVAGPLRRRASRRASEILASALAEMPAPRLALVRGLEVCCEDGISGHVVLIEEPELFLRPQAQRYLYRLLHSFAECGNQVIYSTHAPSFLNVARLEELALVEQDPEAGTRVVQPKRMAGDEDFRVLTEFDAERSELFLARAAILVEGLTEKLAFPFVFAALGHDADREAISIVECGGKSNIPLFARICKATGVPFVAVHDRDAEQGREPIASERFLNELIGRVAGRRRTVVLVPDFEGIAGLRGSSGKPERAWRRFGALGPEDVPEPLARAVRLAVAMARD